jgi:hypothetical protein
MPRARGPVDRAGGRGQAMSKLVLVFMIDALGYDLVADSSFLPSLDAARSPVASVLGYSSACIPTIMTGKMPSEHGHLSMYRRARNGSVFDRSSRLAGWIAARTGRDWRARQWVASRVRRRGVTGYYALYDVPLPWIHRFDLCQRRNLYRPRAFADHEGLPDLLVRQGISHRIWDWTVPEARAFAELEAELGQRSSGVLFLYTAELDALMHAVGPRHAQTKEKLAEYQHRIESALAAARRHGREVEAYVFGDHGMAEVRRAHDLWGALAQLPFRVPGDYLYFLDSTMARFWFTSAEARQTVLGMLGDLDYGRVLAAAELEELGAWFPDHDYGEIIFLLDEGEILVPSFMGLTAVKGMHGYHPQARASYTTLLTNRTGIKAPRDLAELHGVLADAFTRSGA